MMTTAHRWAMAGSLRPDNLAGIGPESKPDVWRAVLPRRVEPAQVAMQDRSG